MTVRVACLGAGYFAQFHYDSWARIERATVVGSCDKDIAKAEATGALAFDTLDRMLSETAPDILDIILPPVAQADAIRTAIRHGIKTIICQKPFCIDLAEASDITDLAETAGCRIIIHENFRFQPWYRTIHAAIRDGLIGDVMQITFRLRPGDGQGPDAYLDRQPYFQKMPRLLIHETGVHFIDTFRFLLGNPVSVYADLRKLNPVIAGEDAGYVVMEHAGGVRSILDGNRLADHNADNMRRTMGEGLFEGTKGTLYLHGDGSVSHRAFADQGLKTLLPPDTWDGFGGDCVNNLQNHVICGLLDGSPFENEARDYLTVIRAENAIYTSAKTGRKCEI